MLIEVHDLSKVYNGKRGLFPFSIEVREAEVIAIIGHNGAGKSTLLKILANWILPDSGKVIVDGIDLKNRMPLVRKIGFVPETPNLFENFTVEYNFKLFARLFRIPFMHIEETLKNFNLTSFRKHKIQILSKGLKQRVSIGRSLLPNPTILLLDEPTSGLDFEMTKEIYKLLIDFHGLGKTIIFTSHRPEELRALATRILVLHQGRLVFDGSTEQYFQSEIHQQLYV